jgi:hypothetical protein
MIKCFKGMPVACSEEMIDAYKGLLGNIETENKVEELGIGERILIKMDLKYETIGWPAFGWLSIEFKNEVF